MRTREDVWDRDYRLLMDAFNPRTRGERLAAWIRAPRYTLLQTIGTAAFVGMGAAWFT